MGNKTIEPFFVFLEGGESLKSVEVEVEVELEADEFGRVRRGIFCKNSSQPSSPG